MIKKHIFFSFLKLKGNTFDVQYNQIKCVNNAEDKDVLLNNYPTYLKKILMHANNNVSFYNKRFEKANILNDNDLSLYEFRRLPLLTKDDIRNNALSLTSREFNRRKWYWKSTSGSTGVPIRVIQDVLYNKWRNATVQYFYENLVGIDESAAKKIIFLGSPRDLYNCTVTPRAKVTCWLRNTRFLSGYKMNEEIMESYVKTINSYKPDLVKGHPHILHEFCDFITKKGLQIYQPKVVISEGEKLRELMREKIESVFGTKIYDYYGSSESAGIAGECKAGLLHIFTFNNYIEVLNRRNRQLRKGEKGKVILTTLHNYSMPLIRYEIGDEAILGPKQCKCGNPLPTLKEVMGRITDYFIKEDGTLINGVGFVPLFESQNWIRSFQIIQEDYRKIRILVVAEGYVNKKETSGIDNKLKAIMGKNCDILWAFVDEIPKTESGKHSYLKSLLYHK